MNGENDDTAKEAREFRAWDSFGQGREGAKGARLGAANLLLREDSEGLSMSPAMHKRRELAGLLPAAGFNFPRRGDAGTGVLARQRSYTTDEHGIKAQRMQRIEGSGGWAGAAGRNRIWSHGGVPGDGEHGKGPGADWEHLDAFQAMGSLYQQEVYQEKSQGVVSLLSDRLQVPFLIILVGVLAALAGMLVDYGSSVARIHRISWIAVHAGMPFSWLAYGAISLSLTLTMCAITHYICPSASGGGVPEMKAVLSGAGRPGLLSAQLVVVKITGVIVANAAGLSVGKEGPLIHVTCAMADLLMSTPMFRKVRLKTMKRLEILACACAAGVAATFGSVFGGTLFSVEVTATAYMVDTLPGTFFCAVVVGVVFWTTGNAELFTLISDTTVQATGFSAADLIAWSLLGVVCGLVGATFVALLDALSRRRNYFTRKSLDDQTRKRRMFVVVALCTLLVIPASYMEAVGFSEEDPHGRDRFRPVIDKMYDIRVFGVSWYLYGLLALKIWTTVFSVVQPLPVGLFSPIFIIGGIIGRLFGEAARLIDKQFHVIDINFKPWEFALIGSAAFSAGVTRAVSTAVIVFELSGENHLRLPLGVALMISYFIAQRFTKGIYDALMDTNGTPYLQEVPPKDRNVPAEDLMVSVDEIPCLSLDCTGKEASELALSCQPGQVIPVVQSMDDKVLVGVVLWNDLAIALADYGRRGDLEFSCSSQNNNAKPHDGKPHRTRSPAVSAVVAAASGEASPEVWRATGIGTSGIGMSNSGAGRDGDGSSWPRLTAVANAIKGRVGWLPRQRMAEPALLDQLDFLRSEAGNVGEGQQCDNGGVSVDDNLPPLGPGIPYEASINAHGNTGHEIGQGSSKPDTDDADKTSATEERAVGPQDSPPVGRGMVIGSPEARSQSKRRAVQERAKRTPLRFYLVREGHKFVPVARTKGKKGTWRELGRVPRDLKGVPVVLDPSPYQVTHTTELSKVDIAFRLLRLDNAYVCNAGRLVGVVTRDSLRDFVGLREITPMDECMSLFRAFSCCIPQRLANFYSDNNNNENATINNTNRNAKLRSRVADKTNDPGAKKRRSPIKSSSVKFAVANQGGDSDGARGRRAGSRAGERLPLIRRGNRGYSSLAQSDGEEGDRQGAREDSGGEGGMWNPV